MKVEKLLRTSCSKEGIASAKVKKLDAQEQNVLVHLRSVRSKMLGLQASVAEDVEDGLFAIRQRLATSISDLAAAQQCGIGVALNEPIAPLGEMIGAFKTELAQSSSNIAGSNSASQQGAAPCILICFST